MSHIHCDKTSQECHHWHKNNTSDGQGCGTDGTRGQERADPVWQRPMMTDTCFTELVDSGPVDMDSQAPQRTLIDSTKSLSQTERGPDFTTLAATLLAEGNLRRWIRYYMYLSMTFCVRLSYRLFNSCHVVSFIIMTSCTMQPESYKPSLETTPSTCYRGMRARQTCPQQNTYGMSWTVVFDNIHILQPTNNNWFRSSKENA